MFWWVANRNAALIRHWWWNQLLEGGDPEKWKAHVDLVKQVYGF